MNKDIKTQPTLAGAEIVPGADCNMPPEKKQVCQHEFVLEKTILKQEGIWRKSELLATIVFCKKCGRLGGSSRIKF
mgnify:CR=1 FL=1